MRTNVIPSTVSARPSAGYRALRVLVGLTVACAAGAVGTVLWSRSWVDRRLEAFERDVAALKAAPRTRPPFLLDDEAAEAGDAAALYLAAAARVPEQDARALGRETPPSSLETRALLTRHRPLLRAVRRALRLDTCAWPFEPARGPLETADLLPLRLAGHLLVLEARELEPSAGLRRALECVALGHDMARHPTNLSDALAKVVVRNGLRAVEEQLARPGISPRDHRLAADALGRLGPLPGGWLEGERLLGDAMFVALARPGSMRVEGVTQRPIPEPLRSPWLAWEWSAFDRAYPALVAIGAQELPEAERDAATEAALASETRGRLVASIIVFDVPLVMQQAREVDAAQEATRQRALDAAGR